MVWIFVKTLLSMGLVFALMLGTIWVLKKYIMGGRHKSTSNHAVEVLDRCVVQPKNSVVVLKTYHKILVIGISDKGMHPLTEITDPETISAIEQDQEERNAGVPWILWKREHKFSGFSKYLNHFWNRNTTGLHMKQAPSSVASEL
jgi:flagellar biogenesis protein FliO